MSTTTLRTLAAHANKAGALKELGRCATRIRLRGAQPQDWRDVATWSGLAGRYGATSDEIRNALYVLDRDQ